MTVREVLDAAREAAIEMRRIEEEAEARRSGIGVQGHTYGFHAKNGILDPMRKVDDLIAWQEQQVSSAELGKPIAEAYEILCGIEKVSDSMTVEVMTRYYCKGESMKSIIDGTGDTPALSKRIGSLSDMTRPQQFRTLERAMRTVIDFCESIGIAHLREMGRA